MKAGYDEHPVLIGPTRSLVGILTMPRETQGDRRPAVVIVNTGIVHRVGHHRMYVTLARRLADAGHAVLRFDLSGLGDSSRRTDTLSPEATAVDDTRQAIDWLEARCGATEVVVMGLCAGSDLALSYGHTDRRVVGLVLLDPRVPPTPRFYINYIRERIGRLQSWKSFFTGRGRVWRDFSSLAVGIVRALAGAGGWTERGDAGWIAKHEEQYRSSLDRDIQLFVALTGGDLAWRQTYREQLLEAFPGLSFAGKLRLEYFATSDHIFTPPEDRAALNAMIEEWLRTAPFNRRPANLPGNANAV